MLQLIVPQIIKHYCKMIISILQIIILLEYIYYFVKVNNGEEINQDIISLFIDDNPKDLESKTLEINLLLTLYCYYIQKINYTNNSIYQDKNLDFEDFIIEKFKKVKILSFFQEIYVWILFVFTFLTITWYYQLFFFFKLILFSIVFYKFLNLKNLKNIKKYIWIFIIYCGLNTLLIYFFQFKVLSILKPYFDYFDNFLPDIIKNNWTILGFEVYETQKLPLKLLPHYLSNFFSVLLLWEISRIWELNEFNQNENKKNNENSEIILTNISNDIIKFENEYDKNTHSVYDTKSKKNKIKKIDLEKNTKSVNYYQFILFLLRISFLLCRLYWLFIYVAICIIFSAVSFSFSIIIYIFCTTLCFMLLFKNILNYMDRSNQHFENKANYFKTLKYPIEKRKIEYYVNKYRKISFKLILLNALIFIMMTYIYTLIDFMQW